MRLELLDKSFVLIHFHSNNILQFKKNWEKQMNFVYVDLYRLNKYSLMNFIQETILFEW